MRFTGRARRIANGHLGHARAIKTGQRGNETVQLAIQIHVLQHLGTVGLESGAEIAQVEAGSARHEPVGDARGNLAGDGIVHALLPPAAGDIEALIDFREQRRDIFRSVLEVAIHGDNDFSLGFVKTRGKSGALAEVAPQPDDLQPGICFDKIGQQLEAAVG